MSTIWLIRHGQTEWNASGRWQGQRDIPLNETGLAQAAALARRVADWPIAALYSSDLQRAQQTASIVGHAIGLMPKLLVGLRERDCGQYTGLTTDEILARFPEQKENLSRWIIDPPDGENNVQLSARVVAVFEQIRARHTAEPVALVSHGGAISHLVCHVLGIDTAAEQNFFLNGHTGISRIDIRHGHPCLTLLNDTAHLER